MRCHISDVSIEYTTGHFPVYDSIYLTVESCVPAGVCDIAIRTVCIRSWSWIRWCEIACYLLETCHKMLKGSGDVPLASERRRLIPATTESLVLIVDGVAVAAKDIFRSNSFFGTAIDGLRMTSGDGR